MFAELSNIDWASLTHAYGSAEGVPDLLRGLASEDPDEREIALDGFLGAVHHQGDIYDSTVACLPFLFDLVANATAAGRGAVAELFASLGESTAGSRRLHGGVDADWLIPYREAEALMRLRSDEFVTWLVDADPQVRSAAAAALSYFAPQPAEALRLFERRLAVEPLVECRIALITAGADIAVRAPEAADRVADWLLEVVGGDADPGTRLAALVHLARSAPERAVEDLTGRAVRLLGEISAHPDYDAPPVDDRPATPTLVGAVRVMFAPEREGRADAWTADLVRVLHDALAERVADRIGLVVDQLHQPEPGRRVDALRMGGKLIGCWRGPFENNAHTRILIAECVGALGVQAADFLPLLRAELADPCRHTFRQGLWSNSNIPNDEKLLATCADAVERIAWSSGGTGSARDGGLSGTGCSEVDDVAAGVGVVPHA
jgi:hypothetical protein